MASSSEVISGSLFRPHPLSKSWDLSKSLPLIPEEKKHPLSKSFDLISQSELFAIDATPVEEMHKKKIRALNTEAFFFSSEPSTLPPELLELKHAFDREAEKPIEGLLPVEGMVKPFAKCTKKSIKAILKISKLVEKFKTPHKSTEAILKNLQIASLHYCSRGAAIPILHRQESMHLSFLDYYHKENEASYFRGDGGPVIEIFKTHFETLHPWISKHSFGLVKPGTFADLMQNACANEYLEKPYTYNSIGNLEELAIEKFDGKNEFLFLDVTEILKDASITKIEEIEEKVNSLPSEIVVGGIFSVFPGMEVYIVFEPAEKRDDKTQDLIESDLIGMFLNYQGSVGANPDQMFIKRALINTGFSPLKFIQENDAIPKLKRETKKKQHGLKAEYSLEDISKKFLDLHKKIQAVIDTNPFSSHPLLSHYFPVLKKLLMGLKKGTSLYLTKNKEIRTSFGGFIIQSLDKIYRQINKIDTLLKLSSKSADFSQIEQRIYLSVEEIINLMAFCITEKDLNQCLEEIFPIKSEKLQRIFFTFSSGMACIDNILQAHRKTMDKTSKPEMVFHESSYYEMTMQTGLKDRFASSSNIHVMTTEAICKSDQHVDILFLDLHPNKVVLKEVKTNPVEELVQHLLKTRRKNIQPLTVIVDITTTLLSDQKLQELVQQFSEEIATGKLQFAFVTSLGKFYNVGMDKYQGGVIEFYEQTKTDDASTLSSYLVEKTRQEPISPESEAFFTLLLNTSLAEIHNFHLVIKQSSQYIYDALKEDLQKPDSCIQLGIKDVDIPMLGFHFDRFINNLFNNRESTETENIRMTKLMELYLYYQSQYKQLPLQIRGSFPFPNTAIVECYSALRLVAGIEPNAILDQYVTMFKKVNEDLNSLRDSQKLRHVLLTSDYEFDKIIEILIPTPDKLDSKSEFFMDELLKEDVSFLMFIEKLSEAAKIDTIGDE